MRPTRPTRSLRWLYRRFFAHIRVDENWSRGVREAASKGVVVYVMRSLSFLDFLCLDFLLKKFGLPLVRFVNDLGLWILEPFGKGERRLSLRRQIPETEALRANRRRWVQRPTLPQTPAEAWEPRRAAAASSRST